jgi:hypothetical protein
VSCTQSRGERGRIIGEHCSVCNVVPCYIHTEVQKSEPPGRMLPPIKILVRGCGFVGGADSHAVRLCERACSMMHSAAAGDEKLN